MANIYKIAFVYPDRHVEDIQETFNSEEAAIEYGNDLAIQVKNNESQFARDYDDDFGFRKKIKPYFMVVEYDGKTHKIIFESKRK